MTLSGREDGRDDDDRDDDNDRDDGDDYRDDYNDDGDGDDCDDQNTFQWWSLCWWSGSLSERLRMQKHQRTLLSIF